MCCGAEDPSHFCAYDLKEGTFLGDQRNTKEVMVMVVVVVVMVRVMVVVVVMMVVMVMVLYLSVDPNVSRN